LSSKHEGKNISSEQKVKFVQRIAIRRAWAVHLSGLYSNIPTAKATNQNHPFQRGPAQRLQPYIDRYQEESIHLTNLFPRKNTT